MRDWNDLEPALIGRVEELIDFVTTRLVVDADPVMGHHPWHVSASASAAVRFEPPVPAAVRFGSVASAARRRLRRYRRHRLPTGSATAVRRAVRRLSAAVPRAVRRRPLGQAAVGQEQDGRRLLQIFLGTFGIGRFYLGYNGIAVAQLAVSLLTCGIGAIWPFVDGILILLGKVPRPQRTATARVKW